MSLSHLNGIALSNLTAFDGIASISAINGISATLGADATAPTLSSATIASNGTTLTLAFSEAVTRGAGYADADLDVDASVTGSNLGLAYVSGDGTSTFVYTVASTIQSGETVDLDFNGDADSIEDGSGNDLSAIVSFGVTNNSSQGGGATAWLTAYTPGAGRNDFSGYVGVLITIGGSNVTVSELGARKYAGSSQTNPVKIYSADGSTEIATVDIDFSTGSAGDILYAAITPVVLNASTNYIISRRVEAAGDTFNDQGDGSETVTSVATIVNAAYRDGYAVGAYSNGNADQMFGPVSFKYTSP